MEGENAGVRGTTFDDLPEGCVVKILSFVTPVDACRSAFVSSFFRSAANSDALWETFLPSDYVSVLSNFDAAPSFSSKKELFRALCSPIIYDDGKKSFWLDKMSGSKGYMLAARGLAIESGDNPQNWIWMKHDHSRFPEVAELRFVPVLDIRGEITTSMMSPDVTYFAYLVYKFHGNVFNCLMVDTSVSFAGTETYSSTLCLTPDSTPWHTHRNNPALLGLRRPKIRKDGWREIKLGENLNNVSNSSKSELISFQVKGGETWGNLIIQGIEIRPKIGIKPLKPDEMTLKVRNKLDKAVKPKAVWVVKKTPEAAGNKTNQTVESLKDIPECSLVNEQKCVPLQAEHERDPLKGKAVSCSSETEGRGGEQ
ncbi:F-box protein PP2-B10 [Linum perenne]